MADVLGRATLVRISDTPSDMVLIGGTICAENRIVESRKMIYERRRVKHERKGKERV